MAAQGRLLHFDLRTGEASEVARKKEWRFDDGWSELEATTGELGFNTTHHPTTPPPHHPTTPPPHRPTTPPPHHPHRPTTFAPQGCTLVVDGAGCSAFAFEKCLIPRYTTDDDPGALMLRQPSDLKGPGVFDGSENAWRRVWFTDSGIGLTLVEDVPDEPLWDGYGVTTTTTLPSCAGAASP